VSNTPKKRKKGKKHKDGNAMIVPILPSPADDEMQEEYNPYEEGADDSSIFEQPTGATNSTWVECDKCKKWRRLRGVVDTKKLPSINMTCKQPIISTQKLTLYGIKICTSKSQKVRGELIIIIIIIHIDIDGSC